MACFLATTGFFFCPKIHTYRHFEIAYLKNDKNIGFLDSNNEYILEEWKIESGNKQNKICSETIIKYSPNGNWLITQDNDGSFKLRDENDNKCDFVYLGDVEKDYMTIVFSNDSRFLAIYNITPKQGHFSDTFFQVINLTTMQDVIPIAQNVGSADVQFSPSNRWVYTSGGYWNIVTGEKHANIEGCKDNPTFSADENRLITSCKNGTIKFWDLQTGQEVLNINAHESLVEKTILMRSNKFMLTATDKQVKLWKNLN